MQRIKSFSPLTLPTEFCPFIIFSMETGPISLYNTKTICRYFNKTWYKYKALSVEIQRIKNNFTLIFDEGIGGETSVFISNTSI